MIKVKNLHKKFGDLDVLNGIDEHISPGEVVVVIGPSGSGKSTFLRCLNLLEDVTEGEIYVDDQLINTPKVDINKVRQKMGMVFQQFNLFPHLTIMDNITLAPVLLKKMTAVRHDDGDRHPRDGLCQGSRIEGSVRRPGRDHGERHAGGSVRQSEERADKALSEQGSVKVLCQTA